MAGALAETHGILAVDVARRAFRDQDAAGNEGRAQCWFFLAILVDDMQRYGLDMQDGPTIH